MLRTCLRFSLCAVAVLIACPQFAGAQQPSGDQCWVVEFVYSNNSNFPGSVVVTLEDSPLTHTYTNTFTLQPAEQRTVGTYGLFPSTATSFYGAANADPNLTFVSFGRFQRVADSLCTVAIPAVAPWGLILLGALLVAFALFALRRRPRRDLVT